MSQRNAGWYFVKQKTSYELGVRVVGSESCIRDSFKGYALMVVIEFQELHFVITFRTIQRIITERKENRGPPLSEAAVYLVFFSGNDAVQF